MSTLSVFDGRVGRVRQAMQRAGLEALCVRDTSNIAWITGFDGVFDEERAHALALSADEAVLHTDSRYSTACRKAARGTSLEVDDARDEDGKAVSHAKWLAGLLPFARLGIEDTITLAEYRQLQKAFDERGGAPRFVETHNLVLGLRQVKDAAELERMRAAQAITDAAFEHIVSYMRPGVTEKQVQVELDTFMLTHGAASLAFPSIVATGANGANPHAQPGDSPLEAGQCVVMDFGARTQGYCSDMTRVVFVGQPDSRLRDAYQVLCQANEQVQAMLKPGVRGCEAHELAERVLAQGGYAGKMGHGLGHGVGIDVHEDPVLAPRNAEPLQVGNVVTVEPGIYLPGDFGMRLEDCGVIDESGYQAFSSIGHEMVIV